MSCIYLAQSLALGGCCQDRSWKACSIASKCQSRCTPYPSQCFWCWNHAFIGNTGILWDSSFLGRFANKRSSILHVPSSSKIRSTSLLWICHWLSGRFNLPYYRIIRKFHPSSGIACSVPSLSRWLSLSWWALKLILTFSCSCRSLFTVSTDSRCSSPIDCSWCFDFSTATASKWLPTSCFLSFCPNWSHSYTTCIPFPRSTQTATTHPHTIPASSQYTPNCCSIHHTTTSNWTQSPNSPHNCSSHGTLSSLRSLFTPYRGNSIQRDLRFHSFRWIGNSHHNIFLLATLTIGRCTFWGACSRIWSLFFLRFSWWGGPEGL